MPTPLKVPMPFILYVSIRKRDAVRWQDNEGPGSHAFCFYPPNSTEDWPKTVGDIKDVQMRAECEFAGTGAIGSMHPILLYSVICFVWTHPLVVVDGVIYTDDCVFWLSILKREKPSYIAYGKSPNS